MFWKALSDSKFVTGFGSIGGEEFFSYLNISALNRFCLRHRDWSNDITLHVSEPRAVLTRAIEATLSLGG